ncbi:HD domain-containing protein [Nonomuraea sp. NBC_01738]|uniref:HD domain-containing protein n=1 Tax=Nonomuraea sp. NBC_01738 TaxID=2976003 RepID=UPI002E0DDC8F|nr:HD domain-containing protein [Nonomuraea sp. NBC_01738]
MEYQDIEVPDTAACHTALEVATAFHSPSLLNHSVRAYLFAAIYGELNGIAFDAELLYVSSMLHDIGMTREFDSHTVPFEEAGGHVAWVFGAGAGWPVERRKRAAEVIIRHMWDKVDVEADPEGHLLELSTAMDISGRRTGDIPASLRAEVLARYPRLDLVTEFTACMTEQGTRKPESLAGGFVRAGIAERLAGNPLNREG